VQNTKFTYEYRDADNYHIRREVVMAGEMKLADLEPHMERGVCEYYGFIPSQVLLENLQQELANEGDGKLDDSDHVWHSIVEMELTSEEPTVTFTATDFLEAFRKVAMQWDVIGVCETLGVHPI
jgi:hypothetical protein